MLVKIRMNVAASSPDNIHFLKVTRLLGGTQYVARKAMIAPRLYAIAVGKGLITLKKWGMTMTATTNSKFFTMLSA
jgi:hypothetical protein